MCALAGAHTHAHHMCPHRSPLRASRASPTLHRHPMIVVSFLDALFHLWDFLDTEILSVHVVLMPASEPVHC